MFCFRYKSYKLVSNDATNIKYGGTQIKIKHPNTQLCREATITLYVTLGTFNCRFNTNKRITRQRNISMRMSD